MEAPKIVGAKYRVIENSLFFRKGDEVTLVYDAGSPNAWFSGPIVDGNDNWCTTNGLAKEGDPGAVLCEPCWMCRLELIEAPKDLAAENEALRKEVAELKARLAEKEPLKEGDRVRVDVPLEGVVDSAKYHDGTIRVRFIGATETEWAFFLESRLTRIG